MAEYSALQQQYIDSVGGMAHMSAVDIIGDAERRLAALVEAVRWEREVFDVRESHLSFPWFRKYSWLDNCMSAARAAVDALAGEEKG